MLGTGIRAGELVELTVDHVFLRDEEPYIKVHGKGDKWREVGLSKKACVDIHRYITRYRRAEKDRKEVFVNRYGNALTVSGPEQIIARLGRWAHIQGVRCSPHTFRHTFAVNYLEKSNDIYKLSRLMGHTSVSITENYTKAMKARQVRSSVISMLDDL